MNEPPQGHSGSSDGLGRWLLGGLVAGAIILGLLIAAYAVGYHRGKDHAASATAETARSNAPAGGEEAEGEGGAEGGGALASGEEVFAENCSICHGTTGHGGNGGPDLRTMPKAKEQAGAEEQVTDGGGGMPPFGGTLSEEQIKDVAAYVVEGIVGE